MDFVQFQVEYVLNKLPKILKCSSKNWFVKMWLAEENFRKQIHTIVHRALLHEKNVLILE